MAGASTDQQARASVTGSFRERFQFQLPEKFKGTKENWEEFNFQFKAYLSLIDPAYEHDLQDVEIQSDQPVSEDFFMLDITDEQNGPIVNEDKVKRSKELQYLLIMLCTGPATHVLHRESNLNGFESWRLLFKRFRAPKKQKALGLLNDILKPDFSGPEFETKFSKW